MGVCLGNGLFAHQMKGKTVNMAVWGLLESYQVKHVQ